MSRLVIRPFAALARFVREQRGATAVEFAIISIPFMLLIFGLIELGLVMLVTATLDTAVEFAARNVRTGEFQSSGVVTKDAFKGLVCRNMNWLQSSCTSKMMVEAQTFDTFADVKNSNSVAPGTFTTAPPTCWSVGGPKDIVLMRVYYQWDLITPLLNATMVNMGGGKRLLVSATAFLNEPYDPTLSKEGAKC